MGTFHTKIAGVTASNPDGTSRQSYISRYCRPGMPLLFKREPNNPYDPNAVAVYINARALLFFKATVQIGYLNEEVAQEIAHHIDKGQPVTGVINEVTGGSGNKPTFGVNILLTKA